MRTIPSITPQEITAFRRKILRFYKQHGRDLPWRRTTDPYRITIAEIMLQQTQVERVIPKYEEWIARWPNWKTLSLASNEQLLRGWSGLGYNRRALLIGRLAKAVMHDHAGILPDRPAELETLPGIGPYTSRAILIFAFDRPLATIDTNIRRVLLHEFGLSDATAPAQLAQFAFRVLPKRKSRDWHNALMDYSRLVLPKQISAIRPVTRQSRFEGSARQVRGEIIRRLLRKQPVYLRRICLAMKRSPAEVEKIAKKMAEEGIIVLEKSRVRLVD
jgi:A/G-specific adenine glycosylase